MTRPNAAPSTIPTGHRRAWGLVLVLLFLGCAQRAGRDPLTRPLRLLDAQVAAVAERAALDQAIAGYLALLNKSGPDPRVLAGLARATALRGYVDGPAGQGDLVTARQTGLRCLSLNPSFRAIVAADGGSLRPRAAAALEPSQADCLLVTLIAWARWIELRGAGGVGIDLDALEALGQRLATFDPRQARPELAFAVGLALTVRPPILGDNGPAGVEALRRAAAGDPSRLAYALELSRHDPDGAAIRATILAATPRNLEGAEAQRRAREEGAAGP